MSLKVSLTELQQFGALSEREQAIARAAAGQAADQAFDHGAKAVLAKGLVPQVDKERLKAALMSAYEQGWRAAPMNTDLLAIVKTLAEKVSPDVHLELPPAAPVTVYNTVPTPTVNIVEEE